METILVNKLPTRTWNRLGVNETALLWDEAGAVDGGTDVLSADGRLELSADAPYARRTVEITAARGQRVTVYENGRSVKRNVCTRCLKKGNIARSAAQA